MKQQFHEWLKEICRWGRDDWFLHWAREDDSPDEYWGRCYFYTHNNQYCITAKKYSDGHTYLGCTVSSRKSLAGEDWTRGHDMPDGEFNRETWKKIKNAIIQNELVKVVKRVREETIDETPETGPSIGD